MEKVLVFYGGKSVEHDISIITALQAMKAASDDFEFLPIYIDHDGSWWTAENCQNPHIYSDFLALAQSPKRVHMSMGEKSVIINGRFKKRVFKPDAALVCLHGANGEDGAMAGVLQMAQIPYSCPTLASSALCYDKQLTKIVLSHYGVPVLESLTFDSESINNNHIISQIGFPLIVKPSRLGSSVGIAVCHNIKELDKAIESAKLYDKKLVFERFVEPCREFNCAVCILNGRAMPSNAYEIVSGKFYSFDEKYLQTKPCSKAVGNKKLEKQIQALAEKAALLLECEGVVRVDFLMDGEKLFVNEINSIPGSLAGYLFGDLREVVIELVESAKARQIEREKLSYKFDSTALKVFEQAQDLNKYSKK